MVDFSVEQIGENNVITGFVPFIGLDNKIDRNYIYWLEGDFGRNDDIETLFSLNIDTEAVTTILAADDVNSFFDGGDFTEQGSILFNAELNDKAPEDTGFFDGESIFDIPNYSKSSFTYPGIETLENFATWVKGDTLFVFDATEESTTEFTFGESPSYVINNSFVDDDGELQIRIYYADRNDDPGSKIDRSAYLFDGNDTKEIGFEEPDLGKSLSIASNFEGTGIYYTYGASGADDKDSIVYYLYDESGSQVLDLPENISRFTASKNTATWSSVSQEEDYNLRTETINIFNGQETKSIYETDPDDGISDLTISGENVTWIVNTSAGDELFLYDGKETIKLDEIQNKNFFNSSISDRFFAWVNVNDEDLTQLYWYNGEEVVELTDPSLNQIRISYELLDDGIVWIENTDDNPNGEVFKATVDAEDLMGNAVSRLFDPSTRANVYTTDKNLISDLVDKNYEDRGTTFNSADSLSGQPVYTFVNQDNGARIYTIDEDERNKIESTMPDFVEVDEAFHAYETQRSGTVPIYSFQNISTKGEFLTASISSKKSLDENEDFESNGVDFYAFPEGDLT